MTKLARCGSCGFKHDTIAQYRLCDKRRRRELEREAARAAAEEPTAHAAFLAEVDRLASSIEQGEAETVQAQRELGFTLGGSRRRRPW